MTRCKLCAAVVAVGFVPGIVQAAAPPEVWKDAPVNATTIAAQSLAVDVVLTQLPPLLRPAAEFQKLLLQIRSGADAAAWRPQIDRLAQNAGGDSVIAALRELARYWQARLAMREIDKALRQYYRTNVQFPAQLDAVKADLPEVLRVDPWGEPWVYKLAAPQGFEKLQDQRYELGPTRFPHLSSLEDAAQAGPTTRGWKIAPREVSGAKALEIRTAEGKVAVVQPGARLGEVSLAYIGDGWALFADTERLFTLTF